MSFHIIDAQAEDASTTAINLNLTLKLQAAACTINNNQNIAVSLGDNIPLDELDGDNYKKLLPLNINCNNTSSQDTLNLTINGTAASFDQKVLKTSTKGLGIKFTSRGRQIKIGESISFNRSTIPSVYATPIKGSFKIQGGEFTASASVKIEYE